VWQAEGTGHWNKNSITGILGNRGTSSGLYFILKIRFLNLRHIAQSLKPKPVYVDE
jgi:hypothetical protein